MKAIRMLFMVFLLEISNSFTIQWLTFSQTADTQAHDWNISFSTSTSYVTLLTETATGDCTTNLAITKQTATKFTSYVQDNERSKPLYAVGIGY